MGTRTSSIAYMKIETVRLIADYTEVVTIRVGPDEHHLPPGTPFLHNLFLAPDQQTDSRPVGSTMALQYGWDGDTIVFALPQPFTGTLVLVADITTLVHPHEIVRSSDVP